MRIAFALPLILLAACSYEPAEPAPEPQPPAPPAVLGGVDLSQPVRALGNEPFWAVEISPAALVYSGADRPEQRAANPGPSIQGTTATYAVQTEQGNALTVTLIATECSDGMSDRTYPLTARVVIGQETLNGCAESVAVLMAGREQAAVS